MGMANASPQISGKVITGLQDVIEKRSNSSKQQQKPKVISPPKNGSNQNVTAAQTQNQASSLVRNNSPGKGNSSPKNLANQKRAPSRDASQGRTVAPRSIQPFTNENSQGGMSSLLKSPIKNSMQQVPIRLAGQNGSAKMNSTGQKVFSTLNYGSSTSVKGGAVMADHTNSMVTPSAFV